MSTALAVYQQHALEANDLAAMSAQFSSVAMLTRDEERRLTTRVYEHQDKEAVEQLTLAHMRYVIKVAKGYLNYGLPGKDLVQEGTIGLLKGIKHFVPSEGVRLVSYASHWIRAEIQEYILKNWRLVKVATTKAQRKLFFNLRKLRKTIGHMTAKERQSIASDLSVSEREVDYMASRLYSSDADYDGQPDIDDSQNMLPPSNLLSYDNDNPEDITQAAQLESTIATGIARALETLTAKERMIIERRWLQSKKDTLKELAAILNLSLERVRQIEKAALEKMRHVLAD